MEITNENNELYNYSFVPVGNVFNLDAGVFAIGNYSYTATVVRNDKKHVKTGEFTVNAIKIEALNTVANFGILQQLANNNDGKFYTPGQLEQLEKDLINRKDLSTTIFSYDKLQDLINIKWIFYLLIGLLSVEWFIRKRNGAY